MRKRNKQVIASLLATVMLGSLLGGCGKSSETGTDTKSPDTKAESQAADDSTAAKSEGEDLALSVSHQPFSHALPTYMALDDGAFAAAGLDVNVLWFSSGNTQNEALGADEWGAGACGSPPAIAAGIAYDAKIVGFSVDDTVSCDYFVREDSEIAQITGAVEGHPDILGDADTWRGKTILCPTQTSAHYMLIATLDALGLTQNDVDIVPMDVPSAYTAFKSGQGDIVALWDPQSYQAEEESWVKVSSGEASGETMPTVMVASQKAIEENWDAVYAWVKTYFETAEKYQADEEQQSDYLLEMQLNNGIDTDEGLAKRFVEDRPLPTLEQNIDYFKGAEGSRKADEVIEKIVQFFVDQGTYTEDDKQQLKDKGFVDGQFIKALAEEKGLSME